MDNQRIAQIFQETGDILEIQGANRFRVLAYRRAAQNILDFPQDIQDIYLGNSEKIHEIPGIGKDLCGKIIELLDTGKCQYYENLLKSFDKGLLELLRVRGVGPKKVKLFFSALQINSIEKLRHAAQTQKLRTLPGMGEKSELEILKALTEYDKHTERLMLSEALYQAEKIVAYLQKHPFVKRAEYAGSLRRMKETIGDLDFLVATSHDPAQQQEILEYFTRFPEVTTILGKGSTKSSVLLQSGIQADLRVLEQKVFGAAFHYFTGSKEHNIAIRDRAKKMGLKVSEYGVFQLVKDREILIAGKTEEEVFRAVGIPYIIPEMRENRGEIEAALRGTLPQTVELNDLRGDLHVHSRWSDGSQEIEEIARFYRDSGFEYIALTDHSPAVAVAHGLTPDRFFLQWDEIDEINADFQKKAQNGSKPFMILKGVECDILPDGSMDLPNRILQKMDIVIASVHSRFNLSQKEQTARVLKAFQNPYVKIFGHPGGRLINRREPYALDIEHIIEAAVQHKVALEINSQPMRLDLFDYYCRMAQNKGAKFIIDSDSHHTKHASFLKFGIAVAKRGWIQKENVLNTRLLQEFLQFWEKG